MWDYVGMDAQRRAAVEDVRQRVRDGFTWDRVRELIEDPEDIGVQREGEEFEGALEDGEPVYEQEDP